MRLWHMMPIEVFNKTIKLNKPYVCDISKSDLLNDKTCDTSNFKNAYDWLVAQLNKKITNPNNIAYPVWAWHTYGKKNKKPNLNHIAKNYFTEPMVILEIEINDVDVVLSDEPMWTIACLNNFPYFESDDEYDNYQAETDKNKQLEFLEKSWHRIFNVSKSKYIQACFWQLKPEYVRKIYRFNSYLSN